ncbi:unnamed protein product, partial [Owenia fusiformis]
TLKSTMINYKSALLNESMTENVEEVIHNFDEIVEAIETAIELLKSFSKSYAFVKKNLDKVRFPDVPHWGEWGAWSKCPGVTERCGVRFREKLCIDESGAWQLGKCIGERPTEQGNCNCKSPTEHTGGRSAGFQTYKVRDVKPYSYIVSISKNVSYSGEATGHFCGGIITSDTRVMTAAHCACINGYCCSENKFLTSKCDLKNWKISAGLLKPHAKKIDENGQVMEVVSVVIHENYTKNAEGLPEENDIAMIKVKATFNFTKPNVQPCDLPTSICRGSNDEKCERHSAWQQWDCEIAGWGQYKAYNIFPDHSQIEPVLRRFRRTGKNGATNRPTLMALVILVGHDEQMITCKYQDD